MMITIKATAKLGQNFQSLTRNLLPQPTKFQIPKPKTLKISCTKENLSDESLAGELRLEMKKLNSDRVQREEAFKKSRELLFAEMCNFMGLKPEDLKKKWRRMNDEEKWVLVKGFVADWSAHFHPLSVRSVKDLVEEYVDVAQTNHSVSDNLFPDFTKFLGFSPQTE